MLYALTFIVITLNLIFRNSKIMYFIDFLYLLVMLGFSYGSYDTMIYIYRYIYPERYEDFTEFLFNSIVKIYNSFQVDYRTFMVSTSFIELVLLFRFIKKYTKNTCYVIALFAIFPMLLVFEQLRFLMAYTIVLTMGIRNLIDKGKFYKLKFIVYVIIASMIHSSCLIYLIFLLADILDLKKLIILTLGVCAALIMIGVTPQILNFLEIFIGSGKLEIITRIQKTQEGQFGCMSMAVAVFIQYFVFYQYIQKRRKSLELSDDDWEYINFVFKLNIISLIAIPLIYVMSIAFMRISVNLLVLNYIGISKVLGYNKAFATTREKFVILALSVCWAIMLFFFASHTETAFELNVYPFFEENEILDVL